MIAFNSLTKINMAPIVVAAIIGAVATIGGGALSLANTSKVAKESEKAREESNKILASYAGLSEYDVESMIAKRNALAARQKFLLESLNQLLLRAGVTRWKDEHEDIKRRLLTEDYATEITNLIHVGFLGGSYKKKFVEESRKYTNEFNTNAKEIRALNVTIDERNSESKSDTTTSESWNSSVKNFLETGQLSGQGALVLLGMGLVVVTLFKRK
jgi:hypothetical protein